MNSAIIEQDRKLKAIREILLKEMGDAALYPCESEEGMCAAHTILAILDGKIKVVTQTGINLSNAEVC